MEGVMKLLKNYAFILDRMSELQKTINELWEQRADYEDRALKATIMTGMPKGNGTSDPVYNLVEKMFDYYLAEIEKNTGELTELKQQRSEIENALKGLDLFEYKIIFLRYVKGYNFYQVGREIHYSKQRACELHKTIIDKIENSVQIGRQNQKNVI
jgi:DNA-directed RNA polymerase specialized sigma subunit